jgi:hypothetical protein
LANRNPTSDDSSDCEVGSIATVRNCAWSIFHLAGQADPCRAAAFSRDVLAASATAPGATAHAGAVWAGSEPGPSVRLAAVVRRCEDAECALAAAGALARAVRLLAGGREVGDDVAAEAGRRLLLSSPTLGLLCELLWRTSAALSGCPPAVRHSQSLALLGAQGLHIPPAAQPDAVAACEALAGFVADCLGAPNHCAALLRLAVKDCAVGCVLAAPALPVSVRRQLLTRLLGEPAGAALLLSWPCAGRRCMDVPLLLCQLLAAPPECHCQLPAEAAGGEGRKGCMGTRFCQCACPLAASRPALCRRPSAVRRVARAQRSSRAPWPRGCAARGVQGRLAHPDAV